MAVVDIVKSKLVAKGVAVVEGKYIVKSDKCLL